MALDFTVYRQVTQSRSDRIEYRSEPTEVDLSATVRQAILAIPNVQCLHIYDAPYGRVFYGFQPPPNCFYVFCRTEWDLPRTGGGNVMVFSLTGEKLYDGPYGGE